MAVMNEVTEVLHKIEAKLYPNYLGKGGGARGVWFVPSAGSGTGGTRVKVAENLAVNRTAEVVALVPALNAGKYRLEIVTQYSNGTILLKEPRTIKAEPELTVA